MTTGEQLDRNPVIRASRRVITQQIRDSTNLALDALSALNSEPVAGSGMARVLQWYSDLPTATVAETRYRDVVESMLELGSQNVAHLLMSAGDHARALEVALLDSRGLKASVITLVRGCLEAALQVCYLADAKVPPAIALLRACAFQLASAEGSETIAASFARALRTTERLQANQEAVDEIHEVVDAAGFERKLDGRRSVNIGYDGKRANLDFDVTSATKRYLLHSEFIYGFLSGAAHSRGWFLGSTYDVINGHEVTPLPDLYQGATLSMLSIADAITKTLGEYFGLPIDPRLKATHARRHMLVRIGNPHRDDIVGDYRMYHDPNHVPPHATAGFGRRNHAPT